MSAHRPPQRPQERNAPIIKARTPQGALSPRKSEGDLLDLKDSKGRGWRAFSRGYENRATALANSLGEH
ncbi:hypothetical protein SK128_014915, partial [Halocaridina rubra]